METDDRCGFVRTRSRPALPAELDIADSATEDSGGKDGRVDEPVEIQTASGLDDVVREEAEESIDRDIDCVVGDKRYEGARNPRRSGKTVRDVGIEATGVADEPIHRGVADAEDEIPQSNEKKGARHALVHCRGQRQRVTRRRQSRCGSIVVSLSLLSQQSPNGATVRSMRSDERRLSKRGYREGPST
jgi:hypothetical protein